MRQALADVGDALPPPAPLVLAGMLDHADPHPTSVAAPAPPPLFDQDAADDAAARAGRSESRRARRAACPRASAASCRGSSRSCCSPRSRWRRRPSRASVARPRSRCPGLVGRTRATAASCRAQNGLSIVWSRRCRRTRRTSWSASRPARARGRRRRQRAPHRLVGPGARRGAADQGQAVGGRAEAARRDRLLLRHSRGAVQHQVPGQRRDEGEARSRATPAQAPDATLAVVLSKGLAPVTVPDVSKRRYADRRRRRCRAVHLSAKQGSDVFSNDVPKGQVISTPPPPVRPRVRIGGRGLRVARARSW